MIAIDVHEPEEIKRSLEQTTECRVGSLNPNRPDYLWSGYDSEVGVERKTWGELLSNLDSVEDQLRREAYLMPEGRMVLLVEGVATPDMLGTVLWNKSNGKEIYYRGQSYRLSIKAVYAWLYQVEKHMEVYFTADKRATAQAIVTFFQADQKAEHTTFRRHLYTMDFHPNPQVEGLMALGKGVGIGPAKAEELVKRFGTIWNVLSADPQKLIGAGGLGPVTVQRLLRKVGRLDV